MAYAIYLWIESFLPHKVCGESIERANFGCFAYFSIFVAAEINWPAVVAMTCIFEFEMRKESHRQMLVGYHK